MLKGKWIKKASHRETVVMQFVIKAFLGYVYLKISYFS